MSFQLGFSPVQLLLATGQPTFPFGQRLKPAWEGNSCFCHRAPSRLRRPKSLILRPELFQLGLQMLNLLPSFSEQCEEAFSPPMPQLTYDAHPRALLLLGLPGPNGGPFGFQRGDCSGGKRF